MKNTKYLIIFLIAFIVFLSPQLLRTYRGECGIIGYPTYFHARMGDLIKEGEFYDPLGYQGRDLSYMPPFHFLIAGLSFVFGNGLSACYFLGPLLGALIVLIFAFILKEFKINEYLSLLFVLVPISIYSFGHCNSRSLAFLFGMLSFLFLVKEKYKWFTVSFALCAFSHYLTWSIFVGLLGLYVFFNNKPKKYFVIAVLIGIVVLLPQFLIHGFPEKNLLHEEYRKTDGSSFNWSSLNELIMYNNAFAALDPVIFLVALYFLYKKRDKFLISSTIFTFLAAVFFERFRIYMAIPFALAAAKQLSKKKYAWLIILLIIPFSLVMINWFAGAGPSNDFCDSMVYLRENSDEDASLLVDWGLGHQAEFFSQRKVIIDGYAEYAPQINERFIAMKDIYCSDDVSLIKKRIKEFDINYIMKDNCNENYIGFSELFYKKGGVEIYKVS